MPVKNLSFLFEPRSVALITASRGAASASAAVARNLLGAGGGRKLFAVDETGGPVEGFTWSPDIESLPEAPDLAILVARREKAPGLIERLGRRKARSVVLIDPEDAPPLNEQDPDVRSEMMASAQSFNLRLVGPSSIGVMSPFAALNASIAAEPPLKGNLALVSQSGTVLSTVLGWATSRGIGFSHLIDLGETVDVDFGDMLDYLANDNNTRAILLYVERLTHVRKFMSAARLAARMKPVVALKGGRYPDLTCEAILRGGGTAGADAVYHTAFRRAGMLRARDVRELFSAAGSLGGAKALPGKRLAIMTNGSGTGLLAVDALLDQGGCFAELSPRSLERLKGSAPQRTPANPFNVSTHASAQLYAEVFQILLEDSGVDAVLLLHCSNGLKSCAEIAREMVQTLKDNNLKPRFNRLLASWTGDKSSSQARTLFTENSIAAYDTPSEAVSGFMQMVRYRRNQELLMQTPPSIPGDFLPDVSGARRIIEGAIGEGRGRLNESETRGLFEAYGISAPRPPENKTVRPLLAGVFNDALFGPVIFFGYGGEDAEAAGDLAFALPPLNMHLAREAVMRTRTFARLEGACKIPDGVIEEISHLLVKVSQLLCDLPQIIELRLAPLSPDASVVSVVDGFVRVDGAIDPGKPRFIIAPYPKELEETIRLPDGQTLLLRPIRPEDEPAYVRLFESLPPEDIVMRFLHPMKMLPHSLAACLTQLDYDREMALVLIGKGESGETRLLGGVRYSGDADNDRAEFAILLDRKMTGMGLGPMMMRKIIEAARGRGIKELYGDVLSENFTMLKLCKAFGFLARRMPDDAGVVIVSLAL